MAQEDKFTIKFELNNGNRFLKLLKEVNKEQQESNELTDEAQKTSKKQQANIWGVTKALVGAVAAYKVIQKSVGSIQNSVQGGQNLFLLGGKTNTDIAFIQKFGYALRRFGGDVNVAGDTLTKLNTALQQLKFGEGGILRDAMQTWGLNTRDESGNLRSPEELLEAIAERTETMAPEESQDLIGRILGLETSVALLLRGGSEEYTSALAQAAENNPFNERTVELSNEVIAASRELAQIWEGISARISEGTLPGIIDLLREASRLSSQLRDSGFVEGTVNTVTSTGSSWLRKYRQAQEFIKMGYEHMAENGGVKNGIISYWENAVASVIGPNRKQRREIRADIERKRLQKIEEERGRFEATESFRLRHSPTPSIAPMPQLGEQIIEESEKTFRTMGRTDFVNPGNINNSSSSFVIENISVVAQSNDAAGIANEVVDAFKSNLAAIYLAEGTSGRIV